MLILLATRYATDTSATFCWSIQRCTTLFTLLFTILLRNTHPHIHTENRTLHYTLLQCTVLYCSVLPCTLTVLPCTTVLLPVPKHSTVLYTTVPLPVPKHSTVLCTTVPLPVPKHSPPWCGGHRCEGPPHTSAQCRTGRAWQAVLPCGRGSRCPEAQYG